jgi:L-2-hydroxyglutarate oxidase LhgO
MPGEIRIAIIGGGVIGCAVARDLSQRHQGITLFEKNPGILQGGNQSTRNSGVIHSGIYYDRETRPKKADLCVEGNRLLYEFSRDHRVLALKTGKIIVATTEEEARILDLYLDRAGENGVPEVKKITGRMVRELEPNVRAHSALVVPTAGIVDPTTLLSRLHTLSKNAGAVFMFSTEVKELYEDGDLIGLTLRYPDGAIGHMRAGLVINAGGVDADMMARWLNPGSPYELDPIKGESYKFYDDKRPELKLRGRNVYPTPEAVITPHGRHFTVGIHLTPTFGDRSYPPAVGSTVTVGPRLSPVENRNVWAETLSPPGIFSEKVQPFFPGLKEDDLVWHQARIQARLKDHPDFVIYPDPQYPQFISLLGIDSPGLTSSLAIARRVSQAVDRLGVFA